MKYEEAHKFLEVKQREMTKNRHLYNEQAIEINGLAILALEKQIPKKPLLHSFSESHDTYTYFKCPNLCDTYCEVKNNMHFCPKCGQALDWSDTE